MAEIEVRVEENVDAFRESFKFYKRRQPCPDLLDVVDFIDSSRAEVGY